MPVKMYKEMFRVVASNRAVPKLNNLDIKIEKTDIKSLAKCSC